MMKKIVILLVSASTLFVGCNKMLDINSTRLVSEENTWSSMENSRTALMGIYGLTKAALNDHNAHWLYGEVRSGEYTIPLRQDLRAISANNLQTSTPVLEDLKNWRRWYAVINSANVFIQRAPEIRQTDDRYTNNNLVVDIAQARFLRAFAYFYMVRIWGDVPLIVTGNEWDFAKKPRENQGKILAWVEQEMLASAADLPYLYSSNDEQQFGNYYNENATRWMGALVRKTTAYAILAHVAAWQGNYPDVAAYSKFVIDNRSRSNLGLVSSDDLSNTNGFFFDKKHNHLFGFAHIWGHVEASFTGHIEELTLARPVVDKNIPDMYYSKDIVLSFFDERSDQRFDIDTLGNPLRDKRYFTNFNGRYPIFSKFKSIQNGGSDPSFRIYTSATVLTRLEDMYLLRAESLAILGEQQEAIDILNNLRERRGLPKYSQEVNGELIDAIFQERRRELLGEGHRWYDMIRYHKLKNENSFVNQLIRDGGIYWPIARDILNQNNQISQNEFWK